MSFPPTFSRGARQNPVELIDAAIRPHRQKLSGALKSRGATLRDRNIRSSSLCQPRITMSAPGLAEKLDKIRSPNLQSQQQVSTPPGFSILLGPDCVEN